MTSEQFRAARLHLGLGIAEFAELLGISRSHVWRLESPPWHPSHRKVTKATAILVRTLLTYSAPRP